MGPAWRRGCDAWSTGCDELVPEPRTSQLAGPERGCGRDLQRPGADGEAGLKPGSHLGRCRVAVPLEQFCDVACRDHDDRMAIPAQLFVRLLSEEGCRGASVQSRSRSSLTSSSPDSVGPTAAG